VLDGDGQAILRQAELAEGGDLDGKVQPVEQRRRDSL